MIHEKYQEKLQNYINFIEKVKNICSLVTDQKEFLESLFNSQHIKIENFNFEYCKLLLADLDVLKNDFIKIKDIENISSLTEHFKNFLISEFVNFDCQQNFYFFSDNNINQYLALLSRPEVSTQVITTPTLSNLVKAIENLPNYISTLNTKVSGFIILENIKDVQNNIVMVGANGSGKSTFSRFLKNVLFKNISVIPSQQLLYYEIPTYMNLNIEHLKDVYDFQSKDKLGDTSNIKTEIQNDFTNLILALIEDYNKTARDCYKTKDFNSKAIFDQVVNIWTCFNPKKSIAIDKYKLNVIQNNREPYDINKLSDGEKAIFYYTSHILLAKQNSYIVVDEPENHLHTALCDKLWNKLEETRADCKFIYLTHNLDFAVSRNNKTILWNKSFIPPRNWDVEILPQNDIIPQRLMAEIVGSKKTLLFCEGDDKSSLDFRLYNSLFPNFTVVPVKTRNDVIKYVLTYHSDPYLSNYKAIGIVDQDNYGDDINYLKENKIYTLKTTEVENILCDEELLKLFLEKFCSKHNFEEIKTAFFKKIDQRKIQLVANYIADCINNSLHKTIIVNRNDIDKIKKEYSNLLKLNIDELQSEKSSEISELIKNSDYSNAIKSVNLKKELTREICNKYVVDNFEDRALELINKDHSIQSLILSKYFSEINED